MKMVCEKGSCTGCRACIDLCPKGAISIVDQMKSYDVMIDTEKCVGCDACVRVCPSVNEVAMAAPLRWRQGWAENPLYRGRGASGGLASAISGAFIRNGGCVAGCRLEDGKFGFEIARKETELLQFTGSKYVKSNPEGIYNRVYLELLNGTKVLFIGLPCQVAAMRKFLSDKQAKNLYTIDLICHGTPSPRLLERFLSQYQLELGNMNDIKFRENNGYRVHGDFTDIVPNGTKDAYTIAFINGLIQTDNCYNCRYATRNRCADLTLGDSWGSKLPAKERDKGISLAISCSEKGEELLEMADLYLTNVDVDRAVLYNKQLVKPHECPKGRDQFFIGINEGRPFNDLVFQRYPKQYLKQKMKALLIRRRLIHR